MIIKSNFEIVEIGDEHMVIPVGDEASSFQGVVSLNEEAAFILKNLRTSKSKQELVELLLKEYDVNNFDAEKDVDMLLEKLFSIGIITE